MRVTVCQLADDAEAFASDWEALCGHVRREQSDLVLLPEMPFSPWFGTEPSFSSDRWRSVVTEHARWKDRLTELGPVTVLSSEPVERAGRRLTEAFVWAGGQSSPAHEKRYLPDEDGFWEASWYERGNGAFDPVAAAGATVGFQICTELWFLDEARKYGLKGIDILAVPRATPVSERWVIAGQVAAVVAGAFCLSSNRAGVGSRDIEFGGQGWIIDPDGKLLALTSNDEPIVTLDIDLTVAQNAKHTYPRYIR